MLLYISEWKYLGVGNKKVKVVRQIWRENGRFPNQRGIFIQMIFGVEEKRLFYGQIGSLPQMQRIIERRPHSLSIENTLAYFAPHFSSFKIMPSVCN